MVGVVGEGFAGGGAGFVFAAEVFQDLGFAPPGAGVTGGAAFEGLGGHLVEVGEAFLAVEAGAGGDLAELESEDARGFDDGKPVHAGLPGFFAVAGIQQAFGDGLDAPGFRLHGGEQAFSLPLKFLVPGGIAEGLPGGFVIERLEVHGDDLRVARRVVQGAAKVGQGARPFAIHREDHALQRVSLRGGDFAQVVRAAQGASGGAAEDAWELLVGEAKGDPAGDQAAIRRRRGFEIIHRVADLAEGAEIPLLDGVSGPGEASGEEGLGIAGFEAEGLLGGGKGFGEALEAREGLAFRRERRRVVGVLGEGGPGRGVRLQVVALFQIAAIGRLRLGGSSQTYQHRNAREHAPV